MTNRVLVFIGILSLVVALGIAWFAESQYQQLVATTELIVPAAEIPPYTLVTPAMFRPRMFPAPLAKENVYRTLEETRGKISTTTLYPDQLVYRTMLVPPSQFRYSEDERLEVVSFPVRPEQAVGGQVRIGHHINIYRLVLQTQPDQKIMASPDPKVWLSMLGAGIELLVADVPVVDVRSTQGSPMAPPPRVQNKSSEVTTYDTEATTTTNRPLTIITVAVPPEIARDLIRLVGEAQLSSRYLLWVSLTPLVKSR